MAVVSRHGGLAPGMVRTMQEQQLNVILFLYILCQNATQSGKKACNRSILDPSRDAIECMCGSSAISTTPTTVLMVWEKDSFDKRAKRAHKYRSVLNSL